MSDAEGERFGTPTLHSLDKLVSVLGERLNALGTQVTSSFAATDRKLDDVLSRYATKDELDRAIKLQDEKRGVVEQGLKETREGIGWAIKIVIGAVIVAVIGLVLAKGGLKP